MKKIYLILVFCLILILLMPVAFASDDNSTLDNNIENLNDKTTYENMKTVDEKFRDPIDDDFTDVNSTFYELKYNLLEPKSSTIQSDDLTKYYRNESKFHATFFNTNHTPLINTNITFEVNGRLYTKTTNNQGVASIGINLRPGIYYITSTNPVDNSSNINKITVLSTIISEDIVKYYRNNTHYWVTILDGQGNPMPNINVKFNINGIFYTRTTNSNGSAMLSIYLDPGTYIITVTNHNDGLEMSNTVTVLSTIVADTMVKFKSESKAFEAKILNGQGNPKPNTNVKFNINGIIYTKTTDSNGIAKLNINLNPSQYIITVMENELNMGYNIYVYHDMTHKYTNPLLIPITKYIQKGGTYEVKLTEDNGLPMPNKNIHLTINSNTYSSTTNNQGIAKFILNLNPGTYNVKSSYGSTERTRTLTVNPANNGIETILTPLTTTLWTNDNFSVKLKNKNTNATLSNQNIIFYVNGIEYSRTTDNNGIASLSIRFQNSNIYPITASFAGTITEILYKPTNSYKLFYLANNETDLNFENYQIEKNGINYPIMPDDWINPNNLLMFIGEPTENAIVDINTDYISRLSNYLTNYDDELENVISINSYVSSINYIYYINHEKSALNVLTSFGGNCVDQTNVFVSLGRLFNYPSRYISLNAKNGLIGHEIGQILVDGIWITVDNSAVDIINENYITSSKCRYLGNKEYLKSTHYVSHYDFIYYENNSYCGIPANNNLNGLNNFVDYNILISNIVYSKNQNAFKV